MSYQGNEIASKFSWLYLVWQLLWLNTECLLQQRDMLKYQYKKNLSLTQNCTNCIHLLLFYCLCDQNPTETASWKQTHFGCWFQIVLFVVTRHLALELDTWYKVDFFICKDRKGEQTAVLVWPSRQNLGHLLPLIRPHFLKFLKLPKTVSRAGDQAFKTPVYGRSFMFKSWH